MMSLVAHLPVLQVIIPLLGALLSAFTRRGAHAWLVALAVSLAMPVISVALLLEVLSTGRPISYALGNWPAPWGIEYRVDALNAFVLVLISIVGAITMPFARRSIAFEIDQHQQPWFYTMYLLCLTGLLGITVTGDAFNVFVFLEISSLSTYVLIALGRHRRALLAAYQYLVVGTIGATFYVIGIGLLYLVTGTLNLVDIASRLELATAEQMRPVMAALAFITVGVCLKLALFPLHVWLPNAYAYAPSFATSFLAGTATKVAIYLLIRMFFSVFGVVFSFKALPVSDVLLVLSLAATVLASLSAVFEENAKRMLAYSSVAQIGYMTLGISLANEPGLTGGLAHLMNHAVMKTALFLALGAVAYRVGSVDIRDLAGLGRRMPVTMAAFAVAGFGLMGTPGTAGFISKWYLALGALAEGRWLVVFLIVASSLITVIYIGRLIETVWFREPSAKVAEARDPPWSMLAPLVVLAAAVVYLGLDTRATAGVAEVAARALLGGGAQ